MKRILLAAAFVVTLARPALAQATPAETEEAFDALTAYAASDDGNRCHEHARDLEKELDRCQNARNQSRQDRDSRYPAIGLRPAHRRGRCRYDRHRGFVGAALPGRQAPHLAQRHRRRMTQDCRPHALSFPHVASGFIASLGPSSPNYYAIAFCPIETFSTRRRGCEIWLWCIGARHPPSLDRCARSDMGSAPPIAE